MKNQKRLSSVREFYFYLKNIVFNQTMIRKAFRDDEISKSFRERIMLAVTQVNGCRYCSYAHTNMALEAGMSSEEIDSLLAGEFAEVPDEQKPACLFAQHAAEKRGNYDLEAYHAITEIYSHEKAKRIVAVVQIILMGNAYGIAAECFLSRLKFRPVTGSGFFREICILLGPLFMIPWLYFRKIFI